MDLTQIEQLIRQWSNAPLEDWLPWVIGGALAVVCFSIAWLSTSQSSASADAQPLDEGGGFFGRGTWLLARALPDLLPYKARRDLLRSGFWHPQAYDNYLALRNVLVMGTTLLAGAWLVLFAEDDRWVMLGLIGGAVAILMAYSLPRLYLNWRGDRNVDQTLLGLPDALDAIVMGLSGGLPLSSALEKASTEITQAHPHLAEQLQAVRRQAAAGTLEPALDRWAERIDLEEVTTLANLVNHAERTGSSLSGVLRDYADSLRLKRMQRAQERSNRVAIQMLFPTVLCLAPATYIVLLAPPLLDLQKFREQENKSGGLLAQPTKIGGPVTSGRPRSK